MISLPLHWLRHITLFCAGAAVAAALFPIDAPPANPAEAQEENEHILRSPQPAAAAGSCGVERWSVKTGTDADAGLVNLNAASANTVAVMAGWPRPSSIPANNRLAPYETTVWVVNATLTKYKLEDDSDVHLVLDDGAGHTMIAEIPDPACVSGASPWAGRISAARSQFSAKYAASGSFKTANVPVRVTGVGMFDFLHGQTGVAPNGIELHTVFDIVFNPAAAYSISGSAGTAGASVGYTGPASGSVTADASGNYSLGNLSAGSYTLTPGKTGCTFSPASLNVTVGPSAGGKNYTANCGGTGAIALTNGVGAAASVNGASADADFRDFTLAVPSGASNLTIATSGSSGDVDLYVRFGAAPSLTAYDCRPYSSSGDESCPVASPSAGTYHIRVYNYATGSINFTVTGNYAAGGGGTPVERLGNGGFESGTASWTFVSSSGVDTTTPHGGTQDAYMNRAGDGAFALYQSAAIPSTATTGTAGFWLNVVTADGTSTVYDTMTAEIENSSGTSLCPLATYSNVNGATSGWVQKSFTLTTACITAIKGQSVRLAFKGAGDAYGDVTTFRVDDVSLKTN